ncbi:uncharacterized protein CTRU02_207136 [Colletotrichum truncatum]|uniref:Uncharacterized protein n=1 Tax=Colletotrichum truncatum TaxID=5467 RepID=A0ACC3YZY6_COLTU|nr:uncharacterized protein CTRU02_01236 [Colletotrichum truncatum]KAF6800831.1 hypothetical protein CTRU02_01236 [Colletotrichum truncatum]
MTTSGLASPPLSGVISHDVELMNFFASDMPTEWMTWSSDGTSSINPNSVEPSNSSESLGSVSDNSDLSQKGHDTVNENPSEEDFQPEMPLDGTLARDVAGLTSCLFELVPSPPLQNRRAHPTEASKPSTDTSATIRPTTTTLRSILQYSETLRSMVTNSRYQSSKPLPGRADPDVSELALDGPTKLLLLSCYTKIFQAFRQIFADVYSGLKSGANMSDLLYDLRVEDVILDGDDDLKILVLMQVVTHKLNTLGMQLGIPEKHYISVGPGGGPEAAKQYQPRGRQQNSDVTEPTLDAILSGSGIDRCVFWGEHKEINKTMESAAAAFREELGLLRAQLGHRNRCRALSVAT